jgi:subtilase family serine protease
MTFKLMVIKYTSNIKIMTIEYFRTEVVNVMKNKRMTGLVVFLLIIVSLMTTPASISADIESRALGADVVVVEVIKMDPIFPKVGENVTLNATLLNVGGVNATNVTITIEADNDTLAQPIDLGTYHLGSNWSQPNLTNESSPYYFYFYWNTSESGLEVTKDLEYTVTVSARNWTVDENLTNGTNSVAFSFQKADEEIPYVSNLTVDPTEVLVGENVTINATFKNVGELEVLDEPVFFYIDYNWSGTNTDIYNTTVSMEQYNMNETYVEFEWNTSGYAIGNHTVTVMIPVNGNNTTSENITVNPIPPVLKPDLTVLSVLANQSSILQGEMLNLSITVKNVGNDTSVDCMVNITDLYGPFTKDFSISAMDPGQEEVHNVTVNTGLLSVGTHTFQTWVDKPNMNEEWNETNNSKPVTFVVTSKSDLTVSVPEVYVGAPSNVITEAYEGSLVTVLVNVKNIGLNSSLNGTIVSFHMDDTSHLMGNKTLLPYSPSADFNVTLVWNLTGVSPGKHKVMVKVDATDINDELDETNNEASSNFTVLEVIKPPDLTIMDLHLTKTEVAAGDSVNIDMRIVNQGEGPADDFVVRTTLENAGGSTLTTIDETTLPYLAGDAQQFLSLTWNLSEALQEGNYTVKVVIDPDGQVVETEEGNNENSTTIKIIKKVIPETDLSVTTIAVVPKEPKQNEKATITVTVQNTGTKDARNFVVTLYVDDKKVDEEPVDFLAQGGASKAVTFNYTFKEGGDFTLKATVTEGSVIQYTLEQDVKVEEEGGFALGGTTVLLILILLLIVAIIVVFAAGGKKKKSPEDEEMEAERRRLYGDDEDEEVDDAEEE